MNNNSESLFHGFDQRSAEKSVLLNTIYKHIIEKAENKLAVFTSTPKSERNYKSIMEISFTTYCENAIKSNCYSANLAMDNDSGYVSHNHESNLELSAENLCQNHVRCLTKPIYLSEDALLEKPNCVQSSTTPDSLVNSSDISIKTAFSGFDNESDTSNSSIVIEYPKLIIFDVEKANTTTSNECSFTNTSDTSNYSHLNDSLTDLNSPRNSSESFTDVLVKSYNILNDNKATITKLVLGNVTNTCDINLKEKQDNNTLNQKFSGFDSNKENICQNKLVKTPLKSYKNLQNPDFSPDLFSDEELSISKEVTKSSPKKKNDKNIIKKDLKLMKNVQNGLSGVFPPPSVTIIQLSVTEMLNKIHNNTEYFWDNTGENLGAKNESKSLLINGTMTETLNKPWPEILCSRYHGLFHNRSKLSEEFEQLCTRYGDRFVGAETQSSCTSFETNLASPSKRKSIKSRWNVKSPGRRLSHLARRRITFSSANLQAANNNSGLMGSRTRQILVDAKKLNQLSRRKSPRKSPKKSPKKTPSKSPFKKPKTTPSSSAKKKLAMRYQKVSGEVTSNLPSTSSDNQSFKRALFVSPDRGSGSSSSSLFPNCSSLSTITNVRKGTKRALFTSPCKKSPIKKSPFKKRKCSETDNAHNLTKFSRSMSLDIRPSQSELKSVLNRTKSDTSVMKLNSSQIEELSEIHKKKLQWAVYESLRLQNISSTHPQFKVFASVLARVTRRFLPNLSANAPRPEGGTSERMLRIARHHSYAVVKGKSVDEIINEYMKNRAKTLKPQGYVGIEEYNMRNKENALQDKGNTIESIERRRLELFDDKTKKVIESKIDRIRKVISFEENDNSR